MTQSRAGAYLQSPFSDQDFECLSPDSSGNTFRLAGHVEHAAYDAPGSGMSARSHGSNDLKLTNNRNMLSTFSRTGSLQRTGCDTAAVV